VAWTRRRSIVAGAVIGLVVGTVAAVLIAVSGGGSSTAHLTNPGPQPAPGIGTARDMSGEPLPDQSFDVLAGGTARLRDYRGKPLVLNVWAAWCPPCQQEMPAFEQVHQALGDKVQIVGLDRADGRDAAIAFAAARHITYPLLFDADDVFSPKLGISVMPTTLFVSADGVVVKSHAGTFDADTLTKTVLETFDL
jgi:cytochrome c biogenesis protein CcmG, thiol:disulfide interchange protein DsbE